MKVLIAHPGTQYSYQLVKQLERLGLLYRFYTGFAIADKGTKGWLANKLPNKLYKKISNRIIETVPSAKIKTFPLLEFKTVKQLKKNADGEQVIYKRNKAFQEAIPDAAILGSDIVIGFDTSSWILAERCRKLGRKFILDVSIAHPLTKQKVYQQIAVDYPKWGFTLKHKTEALIAIEQQEMELASHIVTASSFTKNSLIENGIAENKISINAYGVDANLFKPLKKIKHAKDTIRFVFVGLVDARKGIPLLLEVWENLNEDNIELTLIGPVTEAIQQLIKSRYPSVTVKGKLSFAELIDELPHYDVMVFPSYFEGFGLVIPEAMACGLCVVTTTATCGADIIENNNDGVVIETGNKQALQHALNLFVQSRINKTEMAKQARAKALAYTWEAYGERWYNTLVNLNMEKQPK